MDNKQNLSRSLQDEHLDFLIRLAYKREAERRLLELTEQAQNNSLSEEIPARETGYTLFCEKRNTLLRNQRKSARIRRFKALGHAMGKIAAVLIIFIAIAMPIAVATIEPVRVQLMELLVDIQDRYTRLSLVNVSNTHVSIPAEWSGEYFPTYIPDGMKLHFIDKYSSYFVLINDSEQTIGFGEYTENLAAQVDTENAYISYEHVHNFPAIITQKEHKVTITWSNGHKYFSIISTLSKDESLRIANSVSIINK